MADGYRCIKCGYQESEHHGVLGFGLTKEEIKKLHPDLVKCRGYRPSKEELKAAKEREKKESAQGMVLQKYTACRK